LLNHFKTLFDVITVIQGVPRLDGARARNKFGVPWEQMYCIEESTSDNVGTLQRLQ